MAFTQPPTPAFAKAGALIQAHTERRLQAVLDTAVDGVILIDAVGHVTLFNPACERMFGYAADEMLGANVSRLMPAPFAADHDRYIAAHRRTGERRAIGVTRETMARRKDGEIFPIELSVGAARAGGEPFFIGILRDISDRKRAAEQRERLIEELVASNDERAHFAHAASHDLREPLRMVSAFCGLLARDYGEGLDARGREWLTLAVSGANQMQLLLDDLVEYGRLDDQAERGVWFESREAVGRVVNILGEAIRASGARLELGYLPRLKGNPARFLRLMQNLIGNALKFVSPGATPRVQVTAHRDGDRWRFYVSDNGIGIDPRHHAQVFEPFKRLHGKTDYAGTGLGLAICRKIVEGFGGEIGVRSWPGQGSTFSFTVRLHQDEVGDGADHA
jgi:two-component system sensor kinase FixL